MPPTRAIVAWRPSVRCRTRTTSRSSSGPRKSAARSSARKTPPATRIRPTRSVRPGDRVILREVPPEFAHAGTPQRVSRRACALARGHERLSSCHDAVRVASARPRQMDSRADLNYNQRAYEAIRFPSAAAICALLLLTLAAPATGRAGRRPDRRRRRHREYALGFLPGGELFKPLIADPRWPHFALAYQGYLDDPKLGNVAAVSFGESFMFYRGQIGAGMWEAGIQAGVFSFFDLDTRVEGSRQHRLHRRARGRPPLRPVLRPGPPVPSEQPPRGRVPPRQRPREPRQRELPGRRPAARLRILRRCAAALRRRRLHLRAAARDPETVVAADGSGIPEPVARGGRGIRPVAAADIQYREENDWAADVSLRAGIEFKRWLGARNHPAAPRIFPGALAERPVLHGRDRRISASACTSIFRVRP